MLKKTLTLIAGLALAALPHLAQANAQVVLTPSQPSVLEGDSFTVLVRGVGFDSTPAGTVINNFQGGQNISLTFDHLLLELVSVTVNPTWTFRSLPGTINNGAGTLTGVTFLASPALVPTGPDYGFDLVTLHFRALYDGAAHIALTGGTFVGKVGGVAAKQISPVLGATDVTVAATTPVPEPDSRWLMAAGLGVFGFLLRTRHLAR